MKYVVAALVGAVISLIVSTSRDIGKLRRDLRNLNDRVERLELRGSR